MFLPNEIILTTADKELFRALMSSAPDGVRASMLHTRALELEEIARFLITFSSELAVTVFGVWLAARIEKSGTKKTTINGHNVPANAQQITIVVNLVLQQHQQQSQENHDKDS